MFRLDFASKSGASRRFLRSRRHFQILRDRVGQYLLQDVGSTTGTFLMIREELTLDDQMIIQLLGPKTMLP